MHARLDAAVGLPRDAQQLDAIAKFGGERDVERGDAADALDMHRVERDRPAERQRGQDRQLVRRIDAVDVERRIGLRVAELLRIGEHFGELAAALAHLRQDVIAGAVQDAGNAQDAVAGETLAQRLDHRDAAGDRGLERQRHAALLRRGGERGAMHGEHRLVGGDHRLAGGDRRLTSARAGPSEPPISSTTTSTAGIGGERHRILVPAQTGERHAAVACGRAPTPR